MGIHYTENGKQLSSQSKSLHGDVQIRARSGGNNGWEVRNVSEGITLFHSHYRDDCEDYMASMYRLFEYVSTHRWGR